MDNGNPILRCNGVAVLVQQYVLTCIRVLYRSFRRPWSGLYVPPLLQSKHKSSITNHHLTSIETFKDTLWKQRDPRRSLTCAQWIILQILLWSQ